MIPIASAKRRVLQWVDPSEQPKELRDFGTDVPSVAYYDEDVRVGLAPRTAIVVGAESFANDTPILGIAADTSRTVFRFGKRFTEPPTVSHWAAIEPSPFGAF